MGAENTILSHDDAVLVSRDAFDSEDAYDIIGSNVSVVNALFGEHLRWTEISRAAQTSYYVDYYLAQVNNGGFSQFVYNCGWDESIVSLVREGLRDMGALRHLALFDEGAAAVDALGSELGDYLDGAYFGADPARDCLDTIDDRFFALAEEEDLIELNAAWLRRHPGLRVLSLDELHEEVRRRSDAVPDRAQRIEAALEAEPRYMKLIRALCEKSGQKLERVTAGDPTLFYDGKKVRRLKNKELDKLDARTMQVTWFFITDKGLHLMAEADGKAAMFDDTTKTKIAEVDAAPSV